MTLNLQAPAAPSRPTPSTVPAVLCLVLPALHWFYVPVVGQVYPVELILAMIVALAATSGSLRLPHGVRAAVALFALALLSAMVSDLVVGTAPSDFTRGWLRIAFTATNLMALAVLTRDQPQRIRLAFLGYVLGGAIGFVLQPTVFAQSDPWKFGLAYPTAFAVALLLTTRRFHSAAVAPVVFAALGVFNVAQGARSLGAICIATAAFLALVELRVLQGGRPSPIRLVTLCVVGAVAAVAVNSGYTSAARTGLLGEEALRKYQYQSAGALGAALGGRYEIVYSVQAIAESPLIGHGSFPLLDRDSDSAARGYLAGLGYRVLPLRADLRPVIPTHSHLFQAWVESGLAAALVWLFVLGTCVRALLMSARRIALLRPLVAFTAISLLWDIFFSPFGGDRRFSVALALTLLLHAGRSE